MFEFITRRAKTRKRATLQISYQAHKYANKLLLEIVERFARKNVYN